MFWWLFVALVVFVVCFLVVVLVPLLAGVCFFPQFTLVIAFDPVSDRHLGP